MRKNQLLAVVLILGVIFMAFPAFADYNHTSTWFNQLDNSTNAGNYAARGAKADDNPTFGSGTIDLPLSLYSVPWDWPGCNTKVTAGGAAIESTYNCTGSIGGQAFEPTVNLQDVFQAVTEGNVNKVAGAQGINQYLDSLFSMPGDIGGLLGNALYIDQTIDQDLADLTHGPVGGQGIWQRLHSTVDIFGTGNYAGASLGPTQALGMDQTVEAFVSDTHPSSGPGDLGNTVVVYLGQWFQGGENLKCGDGIVPAAMCTHNEFGGHGTITATKFTPNTAQHDP